MKRCVMCGKVTTDYVGQRPLTTCPWCAGRLRNATSKPRNLADVLQILYSMDPSLPYDRRKVLDGARRVAPDLAGVIYELDAAGNVGAIEYLKYGKANEARQALTTRARWNEAAVNSFLAAYQSIIVRSSSRRKATAARPRKVEAARMQEVRPVASQPVPAPSTSQVPVAAIVGGVASLALIGISIVAGLHSMPQVSYVSTPVADQTAQTSSYLTVTPTNPSNIRYDPSKNVKTEERNLPSTEKETKEIRSILPSLPTVRPSGGGSSGGGSSSGGSGGGGATSGGGTTTSPAPSAPSTAPSTSSSPSPESTDTSTDTSTSGTARLDEFPRYWSGSYIGTSSLAETADHQIQRALAIDFYRVDESGYLEGVVYVGSLTTGPGETYGTYYVEGSVDWTNGDIYFRGTSWIDHGGLGALREYTGSLDFATATMSGSAWDVDTLEFETPWSLSATQQISIMQDGNRVTIP